MSVTTIYLVGCSAEKLSGKHRAEELYVSERFKAARMLVRAVDAKWEILSGKYGLLKPTELVTSYDQSLEKAPASEQAEWSAKVATALRKRHPKICSFVILADAAYYEGWLPEILALGYEIHVPCRNLRGRLIDWISDAMPTSPRRQMLEKTYAALEPLWAQPTSFLRFADAKGSGWPSAGLYIFSDPHESRLFSKGAQKIIRIGTHGVSDGSASTLWQRLKAHKGDLSGLGNHRTSIFRLHVGTALIARDRLDCPSWGTVTKPDTHQLTQEEKIERLVSQYIAELYVSVLPITDVPSKRSDRAYIEQNLIAIMSGYPAPVECASDRWLGLHCANLAVRRSSLWNVNHTEESFDPGFLATLEFYVDVALGKRPAPVHSIAPPNWYEASQEGFTQSFLFEDT